MLTQKNVGQVKPMFFVETRNDLVFSADTIITLFALNEKINHQLRHEDVKKNTFFYVLNGVLRKRLPMIS